MTLGDRLVNLHSINIEFGIWAETPFTAESECQVGPLLYKDGHLINEEEFVGTVKQLLPTHGRIIPFKMYPGNDRPYNVGGSIHYRGGVSVTAELIYDHLIDILPVNLSISISEIEEWLEFQRDNYLFVASGSTEENEDADYYLRFRDTLLAASIAEIIAKAEKDRRKVYRDKDNR